MAKMQENRREPKTRNVGRQEKSTPGRSNPRGRLKFSAKSQARIDDAEFRQVVEEEITAAVESALEQARLEWEKETKDKLAQAQDQFAKGEKARLTKVKVDLVREHHAMLAEREAYWKSELDRTRPPIRFVNEDGYDAARPQNKQQSKSMLPVLMLLVFLGVSAAYLFAPQWQPTVRSALQPALTSAHPDAKQTIYRLAPWLMPADIVVGVPEAANPNVGTAINEEDVLTVNATRVNLRAEPTLRSDVLRTLDKGVAVRPGEQNGNWVRVTIDGAETEVGWIHRSFLTNGRPTETP